MDIDRLWIGMSSYIKENTGYSFIGAYCLAGYNDVGQSLSRQTSRGSGIFSLLASFLYATGPMMTIMYGLIFQISDNINDSGLCGFFGWQ
jgi:hypothetical protein